MKITLTQDDGTELDVTEHVRKLYDHVVSSMDWGSGFLDDEEMWEVAQVGVAIGADPATQAGLWTPRYPVPQPPRDGDWETSSHWYRAYLRWQDDRTAWCRAKAAEHQTLDSVGEVLADIRRKFDEVDA